jgi:hypothetical protein
VVTDGPFAEAKEMIAGFYLIDARDSTRPFNSPPKSRRRVWARLKSVPCAPRRVLTAPLAEEL